MCARVVLQASESNLLLQPVLAQAMAKGNVRESAYLVAQAAACNMQHVHERSLELQHQQEMMRGGTKAASE